MVSFVRSRSAEAAQESAELPLASAPGAGAFPRVNLLPPVVLEEERTHKAKRVLVGASAVSLLLVGGLYGLATLSVNDAEGQLESAQAQAAALNAQVAQYAEVPKVKAMVTTAQNQAYQALGGEVRWSFLLNDLALTMPAGTSLTSFTGNVSADAPAGAAGPKAATADGQQGFTSVLGTPGIGTITYSGEALGYANVAAFLDAQAKQKTLLDPFATAVTANQSDTGAKKGLTFTSSATVTDAALSHRYDLKAGS